MFLWIILCESFVILFIIVLHCVELFMKYLCCFELSFNMPHICIINYPRIKTIFGDLVFLRENSISNYVPILAHKNVELKIRFVKYCLMYDREINNFQKLAAINSKQTFFQNKIVSWTRDFSISTWHDFFRRQTCFMHH